MAESEDREFEALLAEHADVRAGYRTASIGAEPAARLDAAILAASRKAVRAGPERIDRPDRLMRRLAVPFSAAAVIVLATSLSFLVYEERGTPSAPGSSPVVRRPASAAATSDDTDRGTPGDGPGAPAEGGVASPRAKSTTEGRVTTGPVPDPKQATTEPAVPRPEVPIVAVPAPPASMSAATPDAARPSDALVDARAPRAPMTDAREAQEAASAIRGGEVLAEPAARREVGEALRQAETARAVGSSGPDADRAARMRRAGDATAVPDGVDGSPAAAPAMAVEAPTGVAARRLASPARERTRDSAFDDAPPPPAVPTAEETPAEWIVRVRALVDAGRIGAARVEIARLRCRYPDVTLPPDLPAPEAGAVCPPSAAKEGSADLR